MVPFLRGEQGAHQLVNRTEATVRFLAFSTNGEPDIVLYPDSGKLGAFERLPPGEGLRAMFRLSDTVDYHDGEQPPDMSSSDPPASSAQNPSTYGTSGPVTRTRDGSTMNASLLDYEEASIHRAPGLCTATPAVFTAAKGALSRRIVMICRDGSRRSAVRPRRRSR